MNRSFCILSGGREDLDTVIVDDPSDMLVTYTGYRTPDVRLSLSVPHTEDGTDEWFRITGRVAGRTGVRLSASAKGEDAVVTLTSLIVRPL